MLLTSMESVYLLFVVFVIVGHIVPTSEAIRNMFSPVRSRPQSREDLDKLFSQFRHISETLDAIDSTDFDSNNPTLTADPDYPQIQFDSYLDQGYTPVGQSIILNQITVSLFKSTSDKPKPPVHCKPKKKKPPPERPKPRPKCPKPPKCLKPPPECLKPPPECPEPPEFLQPPPECPKKLKELTNKQHTTDMNDSNLNPDLGSNSKLPSDGPFDSEMPSKALSNAELPSKGLHNSKLPSDPLSNSRLPFGGPYNSKLPSDGPFDSEMPSKALSNAELPSKGLHNSKLPSDPLSNSRLPFGGPYNSKLPSDGPIDSELPFDGLSNSKLPSDGPYNSKFPSNGPNNSEPPADDPYNSELPSNLPYNLNLSSKGPYNSNLLSDLLRISKKKTDGFSYSRLPPVGPNILKLLNDDIGNEELNNNINDVDDIYESDNIWPEKNRQLLENASKKITQTDYDQIIAQKFPTADKLLEKIKILNKLKEFHKINENNEDNNINKNVNKNHNAGNDGNNENSKATSQSPTVKSYKKINNEDINLLLQSEGVYIRTTTSPSVDDDRPVMRKFTKRRFYYQARAVKPGDEISSSNETAYFID